MRLRIIEIPSRDLHNAMDDPKNMICLFGTTPANVDAFSRRFPELPERHPLYRTNASKLPPEAGLAAEFSRQALHASRLRLKHPETGLEQEWFVPPPADMYEVMEELGFGPLDEPATVFEE